MYTQTQNRSHQKKKKVGFKTTYTIVIETDFPRNYFTLRDTRLDILQQILKQIQDFLKCINQSKTGVDFFPV